MKQVVWRMCFLATVSSMTYAGAMGQVTKASTADGFYIGGFAGGVWNQNTSFQSTVLSQPINPYFTSQNVINQVQASGSQDINFGAAVGGGQVGYLKSADRFVYGVVADYGVFNYGSSVTNEGVQYVNSSYSYSMTTELNTSWLFTTRGRVGFAMNERLPLFSAFAGLALSNIEVTNQFSDNTPVLAMGNSVAQKTTAGWTVGGGMDYSFTDHLFFNIEYLYVNFPSVSTTAYVSTTNTANYEISPYQTSVNVAANIIRVGLNYKFA